MSAAGRPLPFAPHGAVDGFVCDTKMAKNMTICGRFGNSCGTPFMRDEYIAKNRQYENYRFYLKDRPSEPWTDLSEIKTEKKRFSFEKKFFYIICRCIFVSHPPVFCDRFSGSPGLKAPGILNSIIYWTHYEYILPRSRSSKSCKIIM
jgi:hypothetical protein